ncbi:MAG: superoxide dismutase family protein [Isosphaeraceae bacterium]
MAQNKWIAVPAVGLAVCFTLAGMRTTTRAASGQAGGEHGSVAKAEAQLIPTEKGEGKVKGTIWFIKTGKGMHVKGEISGLTPGEHGFHVHEFGVWSKDGMASGGHFNPGKTPHASHDSAKRHVGDLGNVKADENGKAVIDIEDDELSFDGPNCILGRGLVVHEMADDLKSQPAGNAGGRLAVAIIGVSKP